MADKPILFSGPMVRALIDGRKTQTRRTLKPQPDFRGGAGDYHDAEEWGWEDEDGYHVSVLDIVPNGYRIGDRLWVRETWSGDYGVRNIPPGQRPEFLQGPLWYWADGNPKDGDWERPRPSIHMPRWASRLKLTVTDVRVQRLQEISDDDAIAEGIREQTFTGWFSVPGLNGAGTTARAAYSMLWDSLNARRAAWASNPWVVALTFETHRCNIDQAEAPQ